jgi:hypothetical protein
VFFTALYLPLQSQMQVGLQREWYDVSAWPQQLQQQLVKPAVAAAARGKGLTLTQQQQQQQHGSVSDAGSSSSSSSVKGERLPAPVAVPAEGELLEQLRQRLWTMLDIEADMCGSSSSSSSAAEKGTPADCAVR